MILRGFHFVFIEYRDLTSVASLGTAKWTACGTRTRIKNSPKGSGLTW